jgi:uncharacterized protein YdeI (YjbR/CyaY-like superfamily)
MAKSAPEVKAFANARAFERWLAKEPPTSEGVWVRMAKPGSEIISITYEEAVEVALCYGWIDGQKKAIDEEFWLQRFAPRRPGSSWSRINCGRAEAMLKAGRMKPAGRREIQRAKTDGRWDAAYVGQATMAVPDDLETALSKDTEAKRFFSTLDSASRSAILYRIHDAKQPEMRARRIAQFVEMLGRHETRYT